MDSKFNNLNAATARKIATKYVNDYDSEAMSKILNVINDAANGGYFACNYFDVIPISVFTELSDRDFTIIEFADGFNESKFTIKW